MKVVAVSEEMQVDIRPTRTTAEQMMLKRVVNSNASNIFDVRSKMAELEAKVDNGMKGGLVVEEAAGVEQAKVKQGGKKKRKRKDRNNLYLDY